MIQTSIIIPTYNHLKDNLIPCLNSIIKYTNLNSIEIIIVANGCKDGTEDYIKNMSSEFPFIKLISTDEPLGYTKATNLGIKKAKGDFLLLLNDDTEIIHQPKNLWIDLLLKPFSDNSTAISGPVKFNFDCGGNIRSAMAFWCVMIKREIIDKIGYLDEIFNPGMGEDADYSIKAQEMGYKIVQVPKDTPNDFDKGIPKNDQIFPIYHKGNGTFGDMDIKDPTIQRNSSILEERYGKKSNKDMKNAKKINISIIIPTYNHCNDLLIPCVESIIKYLDLSDKEVIIVANGCKDNTKEFTSKLNDSFKTIWVDEPIGYTKATNIGIKASQGEYVILLNNDCVLLEQKTDDLIQFLKTPFIVDDNVAVTSPLMLHDDYSDRNVLIFFCAMIKKDIFEKVGLLDESYSPGGGEDIDFCAKVQDIGLKCIEVPYNDEHKFDPDRLINIGYVPIFHEGEGTFKEIDEYSKRIVKVNGFINTKKYNKNIKLNFGCGKSVIPGYLGVDIDSPVSHIIMDVSKKLDLETDSVSEILSVNLLQSLEQENIVDIFKEWKRVLKSDGKLTIEVQNFEQICSLFITSNIEKRKEIVKEIYKNEKISSVWYPDILYKSLQDAGFVQIKFLSNKNDINIKIECKKENNKEEIIVYGDLSVTAEISTKGRYDTTLPSAIMSIVNQTVKPKEILIFDDDKHINPNESSVFAPIIRLIESKGMAWKYIFGERKGQTLNHQKAMEIARTSLIWRLDDDDSADPDVLEKLLSKFTPDVGAIGSTIKIPGDVDFPESICSGKIEDIYSLPHIQWSTFSGTKDVDHLNNSFLFRVSKRYSYDTSLSPVSHREETIFSYRIKRTGYKVLVNGDCTTWHMKSPTGGIRSYNNVALWENDERIFEKHMKEWGIIPNKYKFVVLNNGLGDHFMFKSILPQLKEKYKNIIMGVCYPNVFEDEKDIRLISISDAKFLDNDIEKYNIYRYCTEKKWNKHLIEAFKEMYL